tara:strand:+ start:3579 stop:3974 length:396 start_codon:yes stop_codon:yes gene_type:complete
MTDVEAWQALGHQHGVSYDELVQVMTCRPAKIDQDWQLRDAAACIREAHTKGDSVLLTDALCILLRAEISPTLCCAAVCEETLIVALERDEDTTIDMSVAVRLARMLACKLERVFKFTAHFAKKTSRRSSA